VGVTTNNKKSLYHQNPAAFKHKHRASEAAQRHSSKEACVGNAVLTTGTCGLSKKFWKKHRH